MLPHVSPQCGNRENLWVFCSGGALSYLLKQTANVDSRDRFVTSWRAISGLYKGATPSTESGKMACPWKIYTMNGLYIFKENTHRRTVQLGFPIENFKLLTSPCSEFL